jgi:uncharacterized protein YfdQ (DUF2303 family)
MKSSEVSPATLQITAVQELLLAGKALGVAQTPPRPYAPYAVIPQNCTLQPIPLAPLEPLPDHIRQAVRLDDAESFVLYVKSFRTHTTRVFATAPDFDAISTGGGVEFTAFLDYHEGGTEQHALRVAHTARFPVKISAEFAAWIGADGEAMTQMGFVEFIEANAPDVVTPDSASLMELALNFESKSEVSFQSRVDRVTGGRSLTFQEKVDAGSSGAPTIGQVKVPEFLAIRIPVFEGGKAYDIAARISWRPANGRLSITINLQRPEAVFRQSLNTMRAEIAEELGLAVLTGEALAAKV